jgi:hypothetical protein
MKETTSHTQYSTEELFAAAIWTAKDWFRHFMMFKKRYRSAACDGRFFRASRGHHHKEHHC